MAYCPKCGYKLKITDYKPECPSCGVNLMYYNMEERLAEDADKAIEILKANGEDAYRLGVIGEGSGVQLV